MAGRRFPPPPRKARNPYAGIAKEGRIHLSLDDQQAPKQWQDLWGDGQAIPKGSGGGGPVKLKKTVFDSVLNSIPEGSKREKERHARRSGFGDDSKHKPLPRLGKKGLEREAHRRKAAYNMQMAQQAQQAQQAQTKPSKLAWGRRRRGADSDDDEVYDTGPVTPNTLREPRPGLHFAASGKFRRNPKQPRPPRAQQRSGDLADEDEDG
eukprot:Hpha_TRINITY_DN9725_c0_g1::TRINITY_DN9725_c0_g1_i1::g.10262::m.10262